MSEYVCLVAQAPGGARPRPLASGLTGRRAVAVVLATLVQLRFAARLRHAEPALNAKAGGVA